MRHHYTKIGACFATALMLALGSCTMEREGDRPLQYGESQVLSVSFPGRTLAGGATRSLRAGTIAAADYEKSLQKDHIFFYVFEDEGGQPGRLKRIEPVTELAAGDVETGVTGKVFFRDAGTLHVVPTANLRLTKEEQDALLGKTFAEVSKTLITQLAGEPDWFPMAGEPVKVETATLGTSAGSLRFDLERLTARIDLVNETSTANGGRFEITGARLISATRSEAGKTIWVGGDIDRSFLMKGQTPALKVGDPTYGAVALDARMWVDRDPVKNTNPDEMKMQLYTYENEPGELVIEVKGTFEGKPAEFTLQFPPAVKRNTLYRVALRNPKTTDVPIVDPNNPTIEPAIRAIDWEEGGVSTLEPTQDTTKPVITFFDASTATGAAAPATHTATYTTGTEIGTIRSVSLKDDKAYTMKLTLKSKGAEPMVLVTKADVPWISVAPLGKAVISSEGLEQSYIVTFGKNVDLYSRSAVLEVQNRYFPDKVTPRTIQVTQPAAATSMNQLAYLANANVDELNRFAAVVTEDNVASPEARGKLYQWGRNVPFPYEETGIAVVTTKSNGNDDLLWDKTKYIISEGYPQIWFSFPIKNGDTWLGIVSKATDAPSWYKGTNGGDPSPVGYKLPMRAEMSAMFPIKMVNPNGNFSLMNVNETCQPHGVTAPADFTADYFSTEKNVIYALKMKGGDNSRITAFRYEYRGVKGLKVTARHLGAAAAALDVKSIANKAYWATNAGSDVVRLLPLQGTRSWFDGRYGSASRGRGYYLGADYYFTSPLSVSQGYMGIFSNKGVTSGNSIRPVRK